MVLRYRSTVRRPSEGLAQYQQYFRDYRGTRIWHLKRIIPAPPGPARRRGTGAGVAYLVETGRGPAGVGAVHDHHDVGRYRRTRSGQLFRGCGVTGARSAAPLRTLVTSRNRLSRILRPAHSE